MNRQIIVELESEIDDRKRIIQFHLKEGEQFDLPAIGQFVEIPEHEKFYGTCRKITHKIYFDKLTGAGKKHIITLSLIF